MNLPCLIAIIFIAEIISSYCGDNRGVAVVQQKALRADVFDAISSIITVTIPFIIYVVEADLRFAIPVVIASVVGTHLAARRVSFCLSWPPVRIKKKKSAY